MKLPQYKSIVVYIRQPEIYLVSDACMLLGKNVYNASLFLLYNIISSYIYDKDSKSYILKDNLHSHQKETIQLFNQTINNLNEERNKIYQQYLLSVELSKELNLVFEKDQLKEPKHNILPELTQQISIKNFQSLTLDKTLVEHSLKLKESKSKHYIDYTKIPSIVAQYALHKAVNDVSIYYKSLIEYFKSYQPGQLANIPRLPKYLDKNERLTIELHHSYFSKTGTLFRIQPKHTLYHNFFKQDETTLEESTIELFNQFNLKQALLDSIEKRLTKATKNKNAEIEYTLQTVRFVPQRVSHKGKNKEPLKIECIIETHVEIDDNSPLALLINYYNENKARYKSAKLTYTQLKDNIKEKVLCDFIHDNENKLTYLAGGDLGMNNLFSLALTKGLNQIYTGQKVNSYLTKLNTKLDKLKSNIFEQTLSKDLYDKVKYNQSIKEKNNDIVKHNQLYNLTGEDKQEKLEKKPLTIDELKEIKEANNKVYSNIAYNKTLVEMENYKNNILHQLSESIVKHCVKNSIQCLVVGLNEHWKQEVEIGKSKNRLFMSIPHGKLIELLKYKCFNQGILFITTEESYTSQSSFLHHDDLPTYTQPESKQNKEKSNKDKKEVKVEAENNHSHKEIHNKVKQYVFSGKRNQHEYQLNSLVKGIKKIHADLNGAFNILRKVFTQFKYNGKISIDYHINKLLGNHYHNKLNGALASPELTMNQSS